MGKGLRYCVDDWEGAVGDGAKVATTVRGCISRKGTHFHPTLPGRLGLLNGEPGGDA